MPSEPPPRTYTSSRRWTADEARAALAAQVSSGLGRSEFARREGLDPQRLRVWEKKLQAPGVDAAFVEIRPAARPHAVEHVEVVLPSGVIVRVAETIAPAVLRALVDALTRPC